MNDSIRKSFYNILQQEDKDEQEKLIDTMIELYDTTTEENTKLKADNNNLHELNTKLEKERDIYSTRLNKILDNGSIDAVETEKFNEPINYEDRVFGMLDN